MNTAAVSVISASRLPTPGAKRIRNTSAFLRKLSLNAEKNWHQNSGAKRRDQRSDLDSAMTPKPMPKRRDQGQSRAQEHDPERWASVFGKRSCSYTKKLFPV